MRIKDVRQGLHTLLRTQGLDGLLHLYKRLEKRGRALLLCLLCAEAGWLILVSARLRFERAYLKLRLFLRSVIRNSQEKNGEVRDVLLHLPIAAHGPTRLRRTETIPSTASIF
jgi:hypothetical protein